MKIGIDIDNVISNFNDELFREFLDHDKSLRNAGIINNDAYITRGMFDWSKEELDDFYYSNIERIAMNLKVIDKAPETIKRLRDNGYEIYIISGRDNGEYSDPYKMTSEWLGKYGIEYDKFILTDAYNSDEKAKICIQNDISIMIDDSTKVCRETKSNGIETLLMDTPYNRQANDFTRVCNWDEIYDFIVNYKKEKVNIILDTDTYNECDDQFALAYMLKSQDVFNVEAITIAPFKNWRSENTEDSGIDLSYNEAKKVCELCNVNSDNLIFKGSTDYIKNGYSERNDAVNKIIEIALKNEQTYILGIGAITNIALAIKYEPKIIDRIKVIWLGGHTLLCDNNLHEANFKDIDATRIVFESKVDLTIIPCKGVASNLYTTKYELNSIIKGKSELCNFLYDNFEKVVEETNRTRWPIWDIAVIAYMLNRSWFDTFKTNCPNINYDTSYEINNNNHKVKFVNWLNVDEIYRDLFKKLGE